MSKFATPVKSSDGVKTREDSKAALDHLIKEALQQDENSNILLSLKHEGIRNIFDFLALSILFLLLIIQGFIYKQSSFLPIIRSLTWNYYFIFFIYAIRKTNPVFGYFLKSLNLKSMPSK